MTGKHGAARHAAQPVLYAGAAINGDLLRAGVDARHVDGDRTCHHAIIGGAARQMRGVGAGDQGFGGLTAGIDAGSAEQMPLDQGHRHAGGGEPPRERRPRLPRRQ